MWKSTAAATLASGKSLTLAPGAGTLGYEWDEDVDNGFRPAGELDLSSTTVSGLQKMCIRDSRRLYRHPTAPSGTRDAFRRAS